MTALKPDPAGQKEVLLQTQLERFKDAARQLGCDEDEAAFDEKLKVIAKQKPKQQGPEGGAQ